MLAEEDATFVMLVDNAWEQITLHIGVLNLAFR